MQSVYRPIFKKTISIIWHHKVLWIFGFFTALVGGGGEYSFIISQINKIGSQSSLLNNIVIFLKSDIVKNYFTVFTADPLHFALITILVIILILVFGSIIILSQITLIKAVNLILEEEFIKFKTTLKVSKKYFWKILDLNILFRLAVAVLIFLGGLNVLISNLIRPNLVLFLVNILVFVVLFLLLICVAFIVQYVSRYVIIDNKKTVSAIKGGIILFKNNWLVTMEYGLVLFFISLIINGVLVSLSFYTFSLPFIITLTTAKETIFQNLLSITLFIVLLLSIFIGTLLSLFYYISWTLFFIKLTSSKEKCYSKLSRIVLWLQDRPKKFANKTMDSIFRE